MDLSDGASVEKAVAFLNSPSLSTTPLAEKRAFLKEKGLSDEIISKAVESCRQAAEVDSSSDINTSKPLVPVRPDFISNPLANQSLTVEHYNHLHQLLQEQNRRVEALASGKHWNPAPRRVSLLFLKHRRPFWRSLFWFISLSGLLVGGFAFVLRACLARLTHRFLKAQSTRQELIKDVRRRVDSLAEAQRDQVQKDKAGSIAALKSEIDSVVADITRMAESLDSQSSSAPSRNLATSDSAITLEGEGEDQVLVKLRQIKEKTLAITTNLTMELYMNSSFPGCSVPESQADEGVGEEAVEKDESAGHLASETRDQVDGFSKVYEAQRERLLDTMNNIKKDIRGLKGLVLNRRNFLPQLSSPTIDSSSENAPETTSDV